MKKLLAVLLVVALVIIAWMYLRNKRFQPVWNQPKFGQVTRSDLSVPISATGLIEPNQKIEVKSKASGEVIEVPVFEGKFVRKGDTLVVLKKIDEQRSYDRTTADVKRSEALLAQARLAVLKAEQGIVSTQARLDQLKAEAKSIQFELDKRRKIREDNGTFTPQELVDMEARSEVNAAQQKGAEADVVNARNGVEEAKEAVKLQEAVLEVSTKTMEEAKQRLDETTILSQHDAIVTEVRTTVGQVIQGGVSTITGGTILLTLADVSKKKVVTRVDESDYGRVLKVSPEQAMPQMPGMKEAATQTAQEIQEHSGIVKLTFDTFPDQTFEGKIERVEPQGKLNPGSSIIQFDVHVQITDPKGALLPLGAQAQVEFTVESVKNALTVPAEAVKSFQNERGVWIQVPPEPGSTEQYGKKFVPCKVGISNGTLTEIIAPKEGNSLKETEKVYTKLPVSNEKEE